MTAHDERVADLLLSAAGDIGDAGCAFQAEVLVSTLLGTVYPRLPADREPGQAAFLATLRRRAGRSAHASAGLVARVLDSWDAGNARSADEHSDQPLWTAHLGRVHLSGSYAGGDRYGDVTNHVLTFRYDDEDLGGPDHAVMVVADHNRGVATDVVVTTAVAVLLDGLRADTGRDGMAWFAGTDPATVRAAGSAYLRLTDAAAEVPADGSLAENRAVALARLSVAEPHPGPPPAQPRPPDTAARVAVVDGFLDSPEAWLARLPASTGAGRETVRFCADLIVDFAATARAGDPLRWSPTAVETFLLDWVHPRAVLDTDDVRMLPTVLEAWVLWAARRRQLPDAAVRTVAAAVRQARPEFQRLCATGEKQSPAARALAGMVADGVDPADDEAVRRWLEDHDPAP